MVVFIPLRKAARHSTESDCDRVKGLERVVTSLKTSVVWSGKMPTRERIVEKA